jgi:hypothetical protein
MGRPSGPETVISTRVPSVNLRRCCETQQFFLAQAQRWGQGFGACGRLVLANGPERIPVRLDKMVMC